VTRSIVGWSCAAFAVAMLVLAWGEVFSPLTHTTFGIGVIVPGAQRTDAVVARVRPHSPAAVAGIRDGDVIDLSRLSLSERYRLVTEYSPLGTALTISLRRGNVYRLVTLHAAPGEPSVGTAPAVLLTNATITLLILALIVLLRPSLATAALVLYGAGAVTTFSVAGEFSWLPNPWFGAVAALIVGLFSSLPLLALFPFLVRFPHSPTTARARMRMHVADAIFLLGAVLLIAQAIFEPIPFLTWSGFDFWSQIVPLVITLVLAATVYADAGGEARRRIGWVIAGFVVSAAAYVATDFALSSTITDLRAIIVTASVAQIAQCALPIALAYAVLRHRVLDIGFALNRTVVYATMTTIVVGVVSLADWLAGRLLVEQRLALAVEGFITVGFGFALNWIHSHTERLIDRIVFRRRHLAERRIEYRIEALGFAASASAVDDALAIEAARILDLHSAAVFRRETSSSAFERAASTSWANDTTTMIDEDSLLVRTLRALERPIFLDEVAVAHTAFPASIHRPILAIPIVTQHELTGFALYGNRADGASPDPEEVSLLARLAAAAGNAYGAVEARHWRERAAELEAYATPQAPLPA
jgi:hypothetical protein